jgi:hypothetical protein
MNFTQHKLFIGALKSGVAAVTSIIITNCVDTANPIMSLAWFKHIGIATFFLLLFTEARYWNQWANSGTEQPLPQALGKAQDLAQKTEQAIADVKDVAPKS